MHSCSSGDNGIRLRLCYRVGYRNTTYDCCDTPKRVWRIGFGHSLLDQYSVVVYTGLVLPRGVQAHDKLDDKLRKEHKIHVNYHRQRSFGGNVISHVSLYVCLSPGYLKK